jgi:hypothetical protein
MTNKKVFDVQSGKDAEGQAVWAWNRHNKANQRWSVVYVDKSSKVRSKGYDSKFGFYISRPFYFRSRLPMWRVADNVSNYLRLRRYTTGRRKYQTFKFDRVSNTIKSEYTKSYSLHIYSNGSGSYIQLTTTSSRWW